MATFCKGLSVCHLVRPFEQGCRRRLVPRAWPDGGICKCARSQGKRCRNGKKRLQAGRNAQPLHDPLPSCTTWFLVGLSPRPMAHKTIALTTELNLLLLSRTLYFFTIFCVSMFAFLFVIFKFSFLVCSQKSYFLHQNQGPRKPATAFYFAG